MSTCTGNGHDTRWVVQARLKGEAPLLPQPELPEEPAQQAAATPEGQPPVDTVEQAQTDNTAVLEDKIKELEGKLQQAQQANLDASTAPKKEETAADILADYLQKF